MSDDGSYIAGLVTLEGEEDQSLAIWQTDNLSAPPIVTPANDRMKFIFVQALKADKIFVVGHQAWTGNAGRYECLEGMSGAGSVKTFVTKVYITDTTAKDFEEPFAKRSIGLRDEALRRCFELTGEARIASFLPLSETDVLIERTDTSKLISEFYRVNLESGSEKLIYRESGTESALYWDPRDGELLAKSRTRAKGNLTYDFEIWLKQSGGSDFERHDALTVETRDRRTMRIVGHDERTGQFYVVTDKFTDKAALYFYDPVKRTFSDQPLFAHPEFDVSNILLDDRPETFNQLIAVEYLAAAPTLFFVDPEMQAIRDGLRSVFPGMQIALIDQTYDLSKILFSVSSSATPPKYFLLKDKKITLPIGEERPWLDTTDLRETELIYYSARDGLQIPGLLTLPEHWQEGDDPLPAIVLPHGGPWARDFKGWDPSGWTQFLASRGYAVLQPQYRGSTGWGHRLWTAGDAQWGLTMQDDKDDGAAWLVSKGIADPDRIAIFGYSYGGFAAMAATVRQNGPFKCAIAGAGVSNLTRLGNNWSDNREQRAFQGHTVKGMDPMRNTDNANIPILIYHGDRDVRVPLYHATDFYRAIKDETRAELLVVEDMQHSLPWWPEHHRITLEAIERFLRDDCQL
ncbi:MAG: prolyl oligopeptidase family serine peptidase [Hyphomonadaceae bacterium]|nr:prolyl oligopeptidase family serine peptidase [Hyphomonadaceae bacterium]